MWQAIPLTKVVLRMLVFGVVLGLALGLVTIVAFDFSISEPRAYFNPVAIVLDGAILGTLVGVALALYAGVVHRVSHKEHNFKFAFVIVATIGSLAIVQEPFHITVFGATGIRLSWALTDSLLRSFLVVIIAKHAAIGLMSLYVAGRYLREAGAQFMRSTGQTSD
jgi:hypothetical protein